MLTSCGQAQNHSQFGNQDALKLFHRMQVALGGPSLNRVRDLDWTVNAFVWDRGIQAGKVTRRVRVIVPYQFRKDQEMPAGLTTFYFDGRSGWGRFASSPLVPLSGATLTMVENEVVGFYLNLNRADSLNDYDIGQCAPHTLRFTRKIDHSRRTDIELDPVSWLPRKSGDLCPTDGKAPSGYYSEVLEWRDVDGIKIEQRTMNYHGEASMADIVTVDAKINTGLKASDLARRPD